jgi:hypothetical protein
VELADGTRVAFDFHLFSAEELRSHFLGTFEIEALEGLDFFHGRFAADPRWNPKGHDLSYVLAQELAKLEKNFAANPEFNDHANHLLLIGRKLSTARQLSKQQSRPKTVATLSKPALTVCHEDDRWVVSAFSSSWR